MKKIIIILIILSTIFVFSNQQNKQVIIPKESIRFRVIANSDSKIDQENKQKVATNLEKNIMELLKESNDIETSRFTIKENIPKFKANIEETLETNNIAETYNIDYGKHYFPEKTYKQVKYKAGDYESLVVTLGDGVGANFWCVLFPPLCLLEGEEQETEDIQYTTLVKEVIDKYFS